MATPAARLMTAQTVAPAPRRFDVAEYYRMAEAGILKPDDRVELLEGNIIAMSPVGSYHAACVNRLTERLISIIGNRATVAVQNPIRLDDATEPEPDLAVSKPRADFYATHHPTPADVLLVIEVADTTLKFDQRVKLPLYARAGIPEVWIVDIAHRQIICHTLPEDEKYRSVQVKKRGGEVTALMVPGLTLMVDDILG